MAHHDRKEGFDEQNEFISYITENKEFHHRNTN
jgi:hypothetical protein